MTVSRGVIVACSVMIVMTQQVAWSQPCERLPLPVDTHRAMFSSTDALAIDTALATWGMCTSVSLDGLRALAVGTFRRNADTVLAVIRRTHRDSAFATFESMPLHSDWSTDDIANATMSDDGRVVIVALPNTSRGDHDLYVIRRCGVRWLDPLALGNAVNTHANEVAPFLALDGRTLYFASNGGAGRQGRYDVFVCGRLDDSWQRWSSPVILDGCVNTGFDEISFGVSPSGKRALVTTFNDRTRTYSVVNATLAEFSQPSSYCQFYGEVRDALLDTLLGGVKFVLQDSSQTGSCSIAVYHASADGTYNIALSSMESYRITLSHPGYVASEQRISIRNLDSITPLRMNLRLFDATKPLATVFFEAGSDTLSDSMVTVLRRLSRSLEMRAIAFDIVGYSDAASSTPYMQTPSYQRVASVQSELVQSGFSQNNVHMHVRGIAKPMFNLTIKDHPQSRRVDVFATQAVHSTGGITTRP